MANYFQLSNGVRVASNQPIDGDRYIANDINTRDNLISIGRAYNGLQVYVKSLKILYLLEDITIPKWVVLQTNSGLTAIESEPTQILFNSGGTISGSSAFIYDYNNDKIIYNNNNKTLEFSSNISDPTIVIKSNYIDGLAIDVASNSANPMNSPIISTIKSRGTQSAKLNIDGVTSLFTQWVAGYFSNEKNVVEINVSSTDNWTATSYPTQYKISTVSSGNTLLEERFKITDLGAIQFNNAYSFPTTSGLTDQTLILSGTGELVWSDINGGLGGAENGLSVISNKVVLGGNLTNATTISSAGFDLIFENLYSKQTINDYYIEQKVDGGMQYSTLKLTDNSFLLKSEDTDIAKEITIISDFNSGLSLSSYIDYKTELLINSNNIQINNTGNTNFQGVVYNKDYSANYTLRSLVDKEFVLSLTGNTISGLTDTIIINPNEGDKLIYSGGSWVNVVDADTLYSENIGSGGTYEFVVGNKNETNAIFIHFMNYQNTVFQMGELQLLHDGSDAQVTTNGQDLNLYVTYAARIDGNDIILICDVPSGLSGDVLMKYTLEIF
jgi:hypothetical protein